VTGRHATKHAVVIGGGLAGLAAAVKLAQDSTKVTLLEARPRLGGATHSFERDGLVVDNGQHVFLRCYTEYLDFLRRVGAERDYEMQPRFHVPVLRRDGRATSLTRSGLPAPLHLAGALNKYELLTPKERRGAVFAALKLRRLDPDDPKLDERSFGDWLRANGQGKASIDALWNLFTVAALNTSVDEASFGLAVRVFKTGLLTHREPSKSPASCAVVAQPASGTPTRSTSSALPSTFTMTVHPFATVPFTAG